MAPGGAAYGCGQCMPCRVNSRRVWTHRIMLEVTQHPVNSFWTLTYSDENMPRTKDNLETLNAEHLTTFIKRLRHHHLPEKLRYFNVGEYGEKSGRPHYHAALFNFPTCERGLTRVNRRGDCCRICDGVREIWGKGLVHSGNLEASSASYICGYITKKLTRRGDGRLNGRDPEFARMSLRPGIGASFIPEAASALITHKLDEQLSDAPTAFRTNGTVQPLGRYLTRSLRMNLGRAPGAPASTIQAQQEKLLPLQEAARLMAPKGLYSETFKSLILEANEGKYQRLVARSKIYKKRDSL